MSSPFENAAIRLMRNSNSYVIVFTTLLGIMEIEHDLKVALALFSVNLVAIGSLIMTKLRPEKIAWVYLVYTFLASIVLTYTLHNTPERHHYADILWIVCLILFASIGMRFRFALIYLVWHAASFAIYLSQNANTDFETVKEYGMIMLSINVLEIIAGFGYVAMIVWLFVREQNRVKQKLIDKNSSYERVLNSLPESVIEDDLDGNIVYSNSRFTSMFGYSSKEAKGMSINDLVHKDFREFTANIHRRRINGMKSQESYSVLFNRKDGSEFWGQINVRCSFEGEEIIGTQSIISDIDDFKLTNLKLKEANRELLVVSEKERERLALELHDGLNMFIVAAKIHLESAESSGDKDRILDILSQALKESRNISNGLLPKTLERSGLAASIEQMLNLSLNSKMKSQLIVDPEFRELQVPIQHAKNIYRIVQECVHNTFKHSGADSLMVDLAMNHFTNRLEVTFVNNGNPIPQDVVEDKTSFNAIKRRLLVSKGDFAILKNREGLVEFKFTFPNYACDEFTSNTCGASKNEDTTECSSCPLNESAMLVAG